MPTGVAARCFISTIVPTVEAPAGRCGLIMPCAAFSRRPIRKGVANTLTPGLPIASAVRSGVTVHDTSCVVPGCRSMARSCIAEARPIASGARAPCQNTPVSVSRLAAAGVFLVSLDSTVNIAFPAMAAGFGVPPERMRWVIIAYVFTYAIMSFAGGAWADRAGHARVFGAGLAISGFAFLLAGLAPDFGWFLAARVVQGFGGGLVYGTAPGIVIAAAAPGARGRALGAMTAAIGLGYCVGPLLAGALVEGFGWRAIFHVRVPVAAATLAWAVLVLPRARGGGAQRL